MNYEKVFDRESGLMLGRLLNGKFQSPFNPLKWGDAFTEEMPGIIPGRYSTILKDSSV